MLSVVNKHYHDETPLDQYIGRPSILGNRWTHDPKVAAKYPDMTLVPTREDAVARYRDWLWAAGMQTPSVMGELLSINTNANLVCWCSPKLCHGHVLVEAVNQLKPPPWTRFKRILTVTGHRPNKLLGYGPAATNRLLTVAVRALTELNPDLVITGMALGWDMAIAEACTLLGIPFVAALPCFKQEGTWPDESQRTYHALLAQALWVEVVVKAGYHPDFMMARNSWMVDRATTVLALWDGTSGGTAHCVRYARKKLGEENIKNVYDNWVALA